MGRAPDRRSERRRRRARAARASPTRSAWQAPTAPACSKSRLRQRSRTARGGRAAERRPRASASPSAATGETPARDARAIAEALAAGELSALYLLHCDPLRDLPDRALWERALASASTVIAHASFLTDAIREHATVVFPAEAYAEKEGTIVHPDGRLQRLRPAIARPGEVRAEWQVLAELALRLGLDLDVLSGPMASQQLFEAVPFYAGITLEEIGGRGVRWQERDSRLRVPQATRHPPRPPEGPSAAPVAPGGARTSSPAGARCGTRPRSSTRRRSSSSRPASRARGPPAHVLPLTLHGAG